MSDVLAKLGADLFFDLHVRPAAGMALVVGSKVHPGRTDRRRLYAYAEGWDIEDGEGVDRVYDLELEAPQDEWERFSHVDCVSVLEHTRRPWLVAENLQLMVRRGGTVFVTLPCVWREHRYPIDCWRFMRDSLPVLFPAVRWAIVKYASAAAGLTDKVVGARLSDRLPYYPRTEVCAFGVKP